MTVGDISYQQDYRYLIHRVGSTYKAKSGVNSLNEFEDSSFSTLFGSVLTQVGTAGGTIKILNYGAALGYTVDATIPITSANHYIDIQGAGSRFTTTLIPAGDFPVFELNNCAYFNIEKLNFYDTNASRSDTTPFVKLIDHCVIGTIDKCSFYQTQFRGIGIGGFLSNTASGDYCASQCWFTNNFFRNGYYAFYWDSMDSTLSSCWFNGLIFMGNNYSSVRVIEKTNLKIAGHVASGNIRCNEMSQSGPNMLGGFDWDDAGSHGNNYHKNVFLWDMNYAGNYYAKLSPRDYLALDGCVPLTGNFITGSGINNGAYVQKRSSASYREGNASFSADGKTTDFTVTHNMQTTPSDVAITPLSKDAAGAWFVYSFGNPTFVIRYLQAPPPATPTTNKNVQFHWEARV